MQLSFSLSQTTYVYTQANVKELYPFAIFNEPEAPTAIVSMEKASSAGLSFTFPCRYLRLKEKTSLASVGITAEVAKVLAEQAIPCNVVAAFNYDYFFVSADQAERALGLLNDAFAIT